MSFNAPPGKLDLRLTIEGDGTGTLDVEDRDLMVPDLSAPEVMVTTPKVWVARTAREFTALDLSRVAPAGGDAGVPPHRSPADSL